MKKKIILTLSFLPLALASLSLSSCEKGPSGYVFEESDNSKGSVGYEIFPISYKDSNGDGYGDLNGIKSKLSYLQDLGIKRIWLTPIMPSPSYHKYDVKDYYSIDPTFGTLEDFDALIAEAKKDGIDVIIDLVINHSSSQNPYFVQASKDYAQGKTGSDSKATWYNFSHTSLEGYHQDGYGDYYESRFSSSMPDFNLDNADVVAEIHKIVDFWLGHGVSGFRLDATTYYYYMDVAKNVSFLSGLHSYITSKKADAYVVGEAWETSQDTIANYAASGFRFFNFPTAELNGSGAGAALTYKSSFSSFTSSVVAAQSKIAAASSASSPVFFMTNHDQSRWGGYFSVDKSLQPARRKLAVNMYLLTPGTPWMYYGEEVAMLGTKGSNTDAPLRTGMVWGGGEERCKNPENYSDSASQVSVGANDSLKDGWGLVNHYKKAIHLRNLYNDVFEKGTYSVLANDATKVASFSIDYEGATYYLVHNADSKSASLPLSGTILGEIPCKEQFSTLGNGTLSLAPLTSVFVKK